MLEMEIEIEIEMEMEMEIEMEMRNGRFVVLQSNERKVTDKRQSGG